MGVVSSIVTFFQKDFRTFLVKSYKKIPSLYKRTFWTVFIALNIVFAYHTAHFIWGNHEWVYMREGISWKGFWYEARFTETLPYALFGFEFLPIALNLFAFAGISASVLALAIYWKLPKEKWIYLGFCLMMAFIPYNLNWLYHVAQTTFLWGTLIIILALSLIDKITEKKISFYYHLLVIFLLWFVLGFNAAFINTIFICFIGRFLLDLCQGKELIPLIKKGLIGFIDIVISACLLKGTIVLLDKYDFLGDDFYNVNTIALSEVWSKFKEVLGYSFEQFKITYPFFEKPCVYVSMLLLILGLFTLGVSFFKKRSYKTFPLFLLGIFGILFASQLAIFISENRIKLQFMFRLTGFFSLQFIFAFMLAILCIFWKKHVLRNILFVLMIGITGLFIQRDMYAMRVWKQGLDAENKVFDRIMIRLENLQDFSYDKQYRIVVVGEYSLRERFYQGDPKEMDASVLSWAYRAPWTYPAFFNFYAPKDFIKGGFQNGWGFQYVEKLFTHLSQDTIEYLLEYAQIWPSKESVVIKDGIIFIFIDKNDMRTFKSILSDYYKRRRFFQDSDSIKQIEAYHPHWGSVNTLEFKTFDRVMRPESGDSATILFFDENKIILKWDDFGTETFLKNDTGVYEYIEKEGNYFENEFIFASHKAWPPAWKPQKLKFISRNKILRVANNDMAIVEKFTKDELVLRWYSYGRERFKKDASGVYRFQE